MGHILDLASQAMTFTLEQGLVEHAPSVIEVDPNWMPQTPVAEEAFADIQPASKGKKATPKVTEAPASAVESKPTSKRRSVGSTSTMPKPVDPLQPETIETETIQEATNTEPIKSSKTSGPGKEKPKKATKKTADKPDVMAPIEIEEVATPPLADETVFSAPESSADSGPKPKRLSEARRLAMLKGEESAIPQPKAPLRAKSEAENTIEAISPTVDDMKPLPRSLKLKVTARAARSQEQAKAPQPSVAEVSRISVGLQAYTHGQGPRFGLLQASEKPAQRASETIHVSLKQFLSGQAEPAVEAQNTFETPIKPPAELPSPEELFFDIQPLQDVILFEETSTGTQTDPEAPPEVWHVSAQLLSQISKPLNHAVISSPVPAENAASDKASPPKETIAVKLLHLTTGFNPDKAFEEGLEDAAWLDLDSSETTFELPGEGLLGLEHGPLPGQEHTESDRTLLFDETRIVEAGGQLLRIVQTLNHACLLLIERADDFALAVDNGYALAILKTFPLDTPAAQDLEAIPLDVQMTRLPRKTLCAVTIGTWQGVICEDTRGVRLEAEVVAVD